MSERLGQAGRFVLAVVLVGVAWQTVSGLGW